MSEGKSKRGFASMSPEERARISSLGGKAAHEKGAAHEWTKEEAQAAGRKGGAAHSKAHMKKIAEAPRPQPSASRGGE